MYLRRYVYLRTISYTGAAEAETVANTRRKHKKGEKREKKKE